MYDPASLSLHFLTPLIKQSLSYHPTLPSLHALSPLIPLSLPYTLSHLSSHFPFHTHSLTSHPTFPSFTSHSTFFSSTTLSLLYHRALFHSKLSHPTLPSFKTPFFCHPSPALSCQQNLSSFPALSFKLILFSFYILSLVVLNQNQSAPAFTPLSYLLLHSFSTH